jgi:hypothetical protein
LLTPVSIWKVCKKKYRKPLLRAEVCIEGPSAVEDQSIFIFNFIVKLLVIYICVYPSLIAQNRKFTMLKNYFTCIPH